MIASITLRADRVGGRRSRCRIANINSVAEIPDGLDHRHVLPRVWSGATVTTLRHVDHFATTEAFGFIDAVVYFVADGLQVGDDVDRAVEILGAGGLVACRRPRPCTASPPTPRTTTRYAGSTRSRAVPPDTR